MPQKYRDKTSWIEALCEQCRVTFRHRASEQRRFCSRRCASNHAVGRERVSANVRVWQFINQTATCWLWTGAKSPGGYGAFNVKRRVVRAHRFIWELLCGPIPDGLEVCHNCPGRDNPSCVRPEHMFLGTHAENLTDMVRKGQSRFVLRDYARSGESHRSARLTENQVRTIRQRYAASGITQYDLAREYGVSQFAISSIIRGRTWRHIE